ncbi:MAG: BON domain-containing protein [Comamonadaceae bacterium]|nr:BON domain-containing protein [Comamonadaceae bacterium]
MKQNIQRLVTLLAVAGSLGATLSACVPVIMGGAVVGTAMVASDRRTSGAQLEDEGIELRAVNRIQEALGDRAHINVTSFNRRALITGEVPTALDKQQVEQIVLKVDNVQAVVNELAVLGHSSLSTRSSDVLITGRVKASMVDAKDLFANAFKVVTERGNVYLMGRVTQRESDRATDIARSTSGVLKVVRVFEIITEEELRNLQPKPTPVETKRP